jgi:hypothetical protein
MIPEKPKTIYHSHLVSRGEVEATIKGDPLESTKKRGEFYTTLTIDGFDHYLIIESDDIKAALTGYRGQTVVLRASGSGKDGQAHLDVEGINVGQTPPPAQQQRAAAPPQRAQGHIPTPAAQPRQQELPQQQEPPPQQRGSTTRQAPTPEELMKDAKASMMQIVNLHLMVAKAVAKYEVPQFKKLTGHDMSEGQQQAATASVFITCERSGMVRQMPTTPLE